MQKIRQKYRQYRRCYENRQLCELVCSCIILTGCIISMLSQAETAGLSTVKGGYSSVVLHSGGSIYVFIGIAAFAAGVTITVLCIRFREKNDSVSEEKEDS